MKRLLVLSSLALCIVGTSCNVKKEESGELPDVDVDVTADAGKLPEYEVNWADIDVGMRTRTVEIPKVMVVMEEEEVEVPFITMDMPNEESEERSLIVEAEVSDVEHNLEIEEIRAINKKLYVISTLEATGKDLGGKTIRIQDQVDINAPDLDVKHIIVGKKADRVFNNSYRYVDSMQDVDEMLENAKVIYSK